MKRLILFFMLLLSFSQVESKTIMKGVSGVPAGGIYTDCSEFPTGGSFYWNGDHTSGTTYGCTSLSTTLNGTMDASVVDSDVTPGVSSPDSGNNVLLLDATGEDITWANTANAIFDINEGQIEFDIYVVPGDAISYLFLGYKDVSNNFQIRVYSLASVNTIRVSHTGNNLVTYADSTDTFNDSTWTKIYARWSLINNQVSVKIGGGAWKNKTTGTVTEAIDTITASFVWATDTRYVDNVKISKDSGL